jgi:hypothetical protein
VAGPCIVQPELSPSGRLDLSYRWLGRRDPYYQRQYHPVWLSAESAARREEAPEPASESVRDVSRAQASRGGARRRRILVASRAALTAGRSEARMLRSPKTNSRPLVLAYPYYGRRSSRTPDRRNVCCDHRRLTVTKFSTSNRTQADRRMPCEFTRNSHGILTCRASNGRHSPPGGIIAWQFAHTTASSLSSTLWQRRQTSQCGRANAEYRDRSG